MYKKLFTILLAVCLIGTLNSSYSNDKYKSYRIVINGDAYRGDTGPLAYNFGVYRMDNQPLMAPVTYYNSDALTIITMSEVSTDARTQYDLQSNGMIKFIIQDPNNANNLHACFMVSTDPGPNYSDRNMRYFYSTNKGTSWTYLGTVGANRSGFGSITTLNDNRAVMTMHNTDGGGLNRTHVYVDLAPGVGAWTTYDPGSNGNSALAPIWPMVTSDRITNRVIFAASQNGVDSSFVNTMTPTGTFSGYRAIPNGETAQQYACAVGTGKYGVAFNTLSGGAALIESTNQGVTWGAPQTILNWNPADSIGTLRSIDMIYEGANPRVLIGLGHVDPVGGTFTPGLPSKEVFWSPNVNGGIPVTVDSAAGLNGSNPTNDVFFSVCRGVIGKSIDNNALYVAYNKARPDTSSIGNNYFDVYFRYSTNNGATWSIKTQVTNLSGQGILADYRYVSISPTNDQVPPNHLVHLITQRDTVPGSSVNGAPQSTARMMYARITTDDPIGIHNIGGEVPSSYQLLQNYPNPFNPSTRIKFALPKSGFVTLKLYSVQGQEIGTLVSQEISAGNFVYELNASSLPSGVYFYTLQAGEFKDSKKMILVK